MGKVYLCGPIAGLTADEAFSWREIAADMLEMRYGLRAISPMRGKQVLRSKGVLGSGGHGEVDPLLTEHAIFKRDRNDVRTCDAMLANFINSPKVSIGSMVEFGWADAWNKPIVCVTDSKHDHLFIREASTACFPDLEAAVDAIGTILGG